MGTTHAGSLVNGSSFAAVPAHAKSMSAILLCADTNYVSQYSIQFGINHNCTIHWACSLSVNMHCVLPMPLPPDEQRRIVTPEPNLVGLEEDVVAAEVLHHQLLPLRLQHQKQHRCNDVRVVPSAHTLQHLP